MVTVSSVWCAQCWEELCIIIVSWSNLTSQILRTKLLIGDTTHTILSDNCSTNSSLLNASKGIPRVFAPIIAFKAGFALILSLTGLSWNIWSWIKRDSEVGSFQKCSIAKLPTSANYFQSFFIPTTSAQQEFNWVSR